LLDVVTPLLTAPAKTFEIIDFTVERGRHALFLAREDVLAAIDRHLPKGAPSGWV
jgi:hypothetical protein